MDSQKRFDKALERVMSGDRNHAGIGTLGEKTLHAVLKFFYEEDETFHEVKVGSFYADIASRGRIIEIQTGSFYPLRKKLDNFIISSRVCVVYPVAVNKTLCWVDSESGQVVSRRLLNKKGRINDVLKVLPAIKDFIGDANFALRIILLNVEEYRLLDGKDATKKKKATKLDKIPTGYIDEVVLEDKRDYMMLVPEALGDSFTFAEFQKAVRFQRVASHRALRLLTEIGVIRLARKEGRKYIYEINE